MDVQRSDLSTDRITATLSKTDSSSCPGLDIVPDVIERLHKARRPLILIGGGVRCAQATEQLRKFVQAVGIPVVHSLMAVDVLPYAYPLRVGMIGTYGNRWANTALGSSDCLLVLGSRLDVRQTGSDTASFGAGRSIIHVDCEPDEINNRLQGCVAVVSTLTQFLDAAIDYSLLNPGPERTEWLAQIEEWRRQWPDTAELGNISGINPNVFMHQLSKRSHAAAAYVTDVGQHQMWAAQSLEIDVNQRFLTSGGMGSMGFGLPASVGAAVSIGRPIILIAGDGGFQCNIQELQTVVRNGLPVKIVVIDNSCHGMVRQFQESYFEERYQSTLWGYNAPDFSKVACAYGLDARTITKDVEVEDAINWLWEKPNECALLRVMVDKFANAYPKVSFGRPITEMEPFLK